MNIDTGHLIKLQEVFGDIELAEDTKEAMFELEKQQRLQEKRLAELKRKGYEPVPKELQKTAEGKTQGAESSQEEEQVTTCPCDRAWHVEGNCSCISLLEDNNGYCITRKEWVVQNERKS